MSEWKDLSEGMPINTPCEVMQNSGRVVKAAAVANNRFQGICQIEKNEDGTYQTTNTFLLKVIKFRILEEG